MTARQHPFAALAFVTAFAGASLAAAPQGLANDGDGGASACPPNMRFDPVTRTCMKAQNSCKRGTVRDRKTGKCVKVRAFEADRDSRFEVARQVARDGRYADAIALLEPIAHGREPRVLNMLGFSHRKLGHVDTGLAYYRQALAIDPDFTLAREYLGEGYVAIGRVDLAAEQLALIGARCGVDCKEYHALKAVIAAADG